MAISCLTDDLRQFLMTAVQSDMDKTVIMKIIDTVPRCEDTIPAEVKAEAEHKRRVPEQWGIPPTYVDQSGKKTKFSSLSAIVKHLGLPMSGIQCDAEGKKCRATNTAEILDIHGYHVSGNGEPKKATEGGKKLTVYHPQSPQMKKLAEG